MRLSIVKRDWIRADPWYRRDMTDAAEIVTSLDRAGYRLTEPRRVVAGLIAERDGHFTAADLVDDARRQRIDVGRATIFRTLELFTELNAVERVDLPSGEHAYVECEPVHHHHVICSLCERTTEIEACGMPAVARDVARRTGFRIQSHRLELFGVCPDCQAADQPARLTSPTGPPGSQGAAPERCRPASPAPGRSPGSVHDRSAQPQSPARRRPPSQPRLPFWQSPTFLVTAAAIIATLVLIYVVNNKPNPPLTSLTPPANPVPLSIPRDGTTLGSTSAPVTMDTWEDFQCPYCDIWTSQWEPHVITDFVAPGIVRYTFNNFAFLGDGHDPNESVDAAVAALCAGDQGKFWEYHDWLYANQNPNGENKGWFCRPP